MPIDHSGVRLNLAGVELDGSLHLPDAPAGLVIVLRATAIGHHDLELAVVEQLNRAGLGALQLGLLTPQEADLDWLALELRFDIALLARRTVGAMSWTQKHVPNCANFGLFGTDTAGAAAIVAASREPEMVSALVLVRGRPDLAGSALSRLTAPTLLIAGDRDEPGIHSSEIGACRLQLAPHELELVPRAGQFFAEEGAIDACAGLTRAWFVRHCASGGLSLVG